MDTTSITSLPTNTGGSAMQYQTQPIQQQMQPQMQPQMQGQGHMQPQGQMQPQMGGLQVNTVSNVSPSSGYNPNVTQPAQAPPTLSKDMIQEVSASIQKASEDGSTKLPSRDISRDTLHLATDVQVNADHVPLQEKMRDYIGDYDDTQEVIKKHMEEQANYNRLDNVYNEIQTPVLIMLIYFLFQLPVVNSMVFKVFPRLFHKDGNLTMSGLFLKTMLYGALYYGIMKGIAYI